MNLKGTLFIISGPSGVGKGTIIRELKKKFPDFIYPISHTTREMRPGEKEGEVYHFITKSAFEEAIEHGEFLEWAKIHQSNYYGTLKEPIIAALEQGKNVIREVDVQGFHSIKKVIPPSHLVTIFITAESAEELIKRITKRGSLPQDEIDRRMESAKKELSEAYLFDYKVSNKENNIEECLQEIVKIIKK